MIEYHPLAPFLPSNSRVLLLGSFPPPANRWSMNFFYPNYLNDMWRIFGIVFFDNKDYFIDRDHKTFYTEAIQTFLKQKGIAIYDTATAISRKKWNASDTELDIITTIDIQTILQALPECSSIITTGELATKTLCSLLGISSIPKTNTSVHCTYTWRNITIFRLPSSSRAYPKSLTAKAEDYSRVFTQIFSK